MNPPETSWILPRGVSLRLGALLIVIAGLLGVLFTVVRPWYLNWGTNADERRSALPGAALALGAPNQTRAIDIDAPAAQVFAWVAQLGQNRAGFYSYSALENLVGCEMPDIRHLDPALQHWSVGDKLWMYPPSKLEGMGHATLLYYEPGQALVFGTNTPIDPPGAAPTGTWSFTIKPTGENSARLLTSGSGGSMPSLLGQAYTRTVFEPLHFVMERRMLEGIKGLAEGKPISRLNDSLQLIASVTTFALFIGAGVLVLIGARPMRRLTGFTAAGIAFQIVTLVQPTPVVSVALVIALCLLIWPIPRGRAPSAGNLQEERS
jgi:hypothetical protein